MTYKELKDYLFSIANEKFAAFSKSLSNSEYISIGVKSPTIKALVKEHINDKELKTEDFELGTYLEIDSIYFGLSLARIKNINEQLSFLKDNIYKAKSWAVTDTLSTYLKKLTFEKFWSFFKDCYNSKYIYTRRMAYILGLKVYKNERILQVLPYIRKDEEYMVMMAEAWLMATIAICYPNEIYDFLKDLDDKSLKLKTISKISDSFRLNDKNKEMFKSLRK